MAPSQIMLAAMLALVGLVGSGFFYYQTIETWQFARNVLLNQEGFFWFKIIIPTVACTTLLLGFPMILILEPHYSGEAIREYIHVDQLWTPVNILLTAFCGGVACWMLERLTTTVIKRNAGTISRAFAWIQVLLFAILYSATTLGTAYLYAFSWVTAP